MLVSFLMLKMGGNVMQILVVKTYLKMDNALS